MKKSREIIVCEGCGSVIRKRFTERGEYRRHCQDCTHRFTHIIQVPKAIAYIWLEQST